MLGLKHSSRDGFHGAGRGSRQGTQAGGAGGGPQHVLEDRHQAPLNDGEAVRDRQQPIGLLRRESRKASGADGKRIRERIADDLGRSEAVLVNELRVLVSVRLRPHCREAKALGSDECPQGLPHGRQISKSAFFKDAIAAQLGVRKDP